MAESSASVRPTTVTEAETVSLAGKVSPASAVEQRTASRPMGAADQDGKKTVPDAPGARKSESVRL